MLRSGSPCQVLVGFPWGLEFVCSQKSSSRHSTSSRSPSVGVQPSGGFAWVTVAAVVLSIAPVVAQVTKVGRAEHGQARQNSTMCPQALSSLFMLLYSQVVMTLRRGMESRVPVACEPIAGPTDSPAWQSRGGRSPKRTTTFLLLWSPSVNQIPWAPHHKRLPTVV